MGSVIRFFRCPRSHFFLFGPRGTGKTTLLRDRFPEAIFVDLVDPELQREYSARPERLRELVAGRPEARDIVVDEIQKVPALLDVVHGLIESDRDLRFVLTGSSARKLKRSGVNLLGGRALNCAMHPFMASELEDDFRLDVALRRGLLPLVHGHDEPQEVLRSYVSLYIREEVHMESLVRNTEAFARFTEVITFSHGQLLNHSNVARECGVSSKTVRSYVEILEDLMLAFRLPVFDKRAQRQLVSHPKFYWFDPGVFASMRRRGPLDIGPEIAGVALEGLVAQQLRAWNDYSGKEHDLCYWRTKSGVEVDFVVYGPRGLWAFEVKHGTQVSKRDLRSLKAFKTDYPVANPRLLYRGTERLLIDDILCIPIAEYLVDMRPNRDLA